MQLGLFSLTSKSYAFSICLLLGTHIFQAFFICLLLGTHIFYAFSVCLFHGLINALEEFTRDWD